MPIISGHKKGTGMGICPFAEYRPLARTITQPRMKAHDILQFHTMGGGSLPGTDAMFHQDGYSGLESHFGVGADGTIYQWVDTAYTADASLDGNWHVISVETADAGAAFPKWTGSNVPAWTDAQVASLVRLGIWVCDTHNIPKAIIPNSRVGNRGIGWHRMGVDGGGQPGYRVSGGERWSTAYGKACPGDRRIAQIKTEIAPRIKSGETVTPAELDQIAHAVWAYDQDGARAQAWAYQQAGANRDLIAAAVVAQLPVEAGGSAWTSDQIDQVKQAVKDALKEGVA